MFSTRRSVDEINQAIASAVQIALSGNATLFVGAGLSLDAKNASQQAMPSTSQLTQLLALEAGAESVSSIELTAELVLEVKGEVFLRNFLMKHLKCAVVSESQEEIVDLPWMRIYTTNFDDVIETAAAKRGRHVVPTWPAANEGAAPSPPIQVVHVNGYVHSMTSADVSNSVKLSHSSYNTSAFTNNHWSQILRSDLESSGAFIFVGYSLFDLDIRRIVVASERLSGRCFFVVSPREAASMQMLLGNYGTVMPIGAAGFAGMISRARARFEPPKEDLFFFGSFDRAITPSKRPTSVTDDEILQLLLYGVVKPDLIWAEQRGLLAPAKYALPRRHFAGFVKRVMTPPGVHVLHSHLGNGKTLFLQQVLTCAETEGIQRFIFSRPNARWREEVRRICSLGAPALVVVEGYPSSLDIAEEFSLHNRDHVTIIFTARTSEHDIHGRRLREIFDDVTETDINGLGPDEIDGFVGFLESLGLLGELSGRPRRDQRRALAAKSNSQIHGILLHILKSPSIRDRVRAQVRDVEEDPEAYRIVLTAFILTTLGVSFDSDLVLDLTTPDCVSILRSSSARVGPFVDFAQGNFIARSPALAQFILKETADVDVVLQTLIEITRRADAKLQFRYSHGRYREVAIQISRFANLQAIFPDAESVSLTACIRYYESVRGLRVNARNPQFWLQYAIARTARKNFDEAERLFQTAYSFAEAVGKNSRRPYKKTYIDNHYARFLIARSLSESGATEATLQDVRKAMSIIDRQVRDTDEDRHYPFRVAAMVPEAFDAHESFIDFGSDGPAFIRFCDVILDSANKLPEHVQSHFNVRECVHVLSGFRSRLASR